MTPIHRALLLIAVAAPLAAQEPVSLAQAVDAALTRGPRVLVGRADTAAAHAGLRVAHALPNPTVSASYSKDPPQYHALVDLPLDYPWLRGPRVGAAHAQLDAARAQFAFTRADVRFEMESAYARALAGAAQARLSRENAGAADTLLTMARTRRDAGDASDLDVDLARVNAVQVENAAIADSLDAVSALLDVQALMGRDADRITITLADTLAPPDAASLDTAATPLAVAAAQASLAAAQAGLHLAQRQLLPAPSIQIGMDAHDPTGSETGALPVIGVSLPLPLFGWYGGDVARSAAERDRAEAELDATRRESAAAVARALREQGAALARVGRDRELLATARAVAAKAIEAYAEGAAALPAVLEVHRSAREAESQYLSDVATARVAVAAVTRLNTVPDR